MADTDNQEQENVAPTAPIILLDNNAIQAFLSKETAPELQGLLKKPKKWEQN
jgi:hypothetical protein